MFFKRTFIECKNVDYVKKNVYIKYPIYVFNTVNVIQP